MFVLNGVSQPISTSRLFAAINVAGGVFAAVAGDNLTYQLEVLVVHVGPQNGPALCSLPQIKRPQERRNFPKPAARTFRWCSKEEPQSQACANSGRAAEMLDALVQKDAALRAEVGKGAGL